MRVWIGVWSSDEAECKSSNPSHDYQWSAVNPHANANPLASGGDKASYSSGRSKSITCAICVLVHQVKTQDPLTRSISGKNETSPWSAEKKTSHKGRSFSSGEKT
ncbi:hypothetical protein BELL_0240g00100 [Botrytis elliptica]|uniref:Uncharacterized protein n=1 Tax=Botrytis elliptica TaxID=278938 RepID=A0A4Z1K178_9HELO|nr:hypothetical protein BELL_0240g00100 [Botrytis elliptica]